MEMRRRFLKYIVFSLLCECSLAPLAWATPNNTMSVTPSCTSGTTITCSDETTRNNNISTPYNAHSHTDISAMSGVNTFTIGDGTSGNKDYCVDSATDRCLRWNETASLWVIQQGGTTYNEVVTYSGTVGIPAGSLLAGNGTGSVVAFNTSAPADDGVLVADSATAGTFRTVPNCTGSTSVLQYTAATNSFSCGTISSGVTVKAGSFTRDTSTATGTQTVSGIGFTPAAIWFVGGQDLSSEMVWGVANCNTAGGGVGDDNGTTTDTYRVDTSIVLYDSESSTKTYTGVIQSCSSGQFVISWTRGSTPTGTLTIDYIAVQ